MVEKPSWLEEIEGNARAFERLVECVSAGDAVAFVGAGASAGLYPLWGGLLEFLGREAVERGLAADDQEESWHRIAKKNARQAASLLKRTLGEPAFAAVLRETFKARAGDDGRRYTPVHSAIVRLSLGGIVTTNYDPGLVEARHDQRPEAPTSYGIWRQDGACREWLHADRREAGALPILFAHGTHDWVESIVLTAESYREAYARGAYRRLFEQLWGTRRLFFVGFGFSDPFLDVLAEQIVAEVGADARHVALVGYDEGERPTPDDRRFFLDAYGVDPIFYPVRPGHDHGALLEALEALGPRPERAQVESVRAVAPAPALPAQWTHETTEDDDYTGREEALTRLDRWAADPTVRMIGVTGIGGLGKTSLIARWLKREGGTGRRSFRGLLFWSFYANRSVEEFLADILAFARDDLGVSVLALDDRVRAVDAVVALLSNVPLCLVLDGLEVLQERPGQPDHGALLEPDLREVLDAACRRHAGLVVLTSRFPFPDLRAHAGRALRSFNLPSLSEGDGAALLARLGVDGSEEDRRAATVRLEGHPLLLRLFARSVRERAGGDPSFRIDHALDAAGVRGEERIDEKMRHLLEFYEQSLGAEQAAIVSLVSLFTTPKPASVLAALCKRVDREGVPGDVGEDELVRRLEPLVRDGLLLREPGKREYSAHPIVRDHFRSRLLDVAAKEAAAILSDRPSDDRIESVEQLRPLVDAIVLLCDAGEFEAADEIYRRVGSQARNWFLWLPAPHQGIEASIAFVDGENRRERCAEVLGVRRLSFYLNGVGLFAANSGDSERAMDWLGRANRLDREHGDRKNHSIVLKNVAEIQARLGQLAVSAASAREAHELAVEIEDDEEIRGSLAALGEAVQAGGGVEEALAAFAEANEIENRIDPDADDLHSLRGVRWGRLLVRLSADSRARSLTEANRAICARYHWYNHVAHCDLLLGRLSKDPAESLEHLRRAETTFRRGRVLGDLPDVLVALADRHRVDGSFVDALSSANEALDIAAPRGHRLQQVEALVARGRTHLAWHEVDPKAAPSDARETAGDDGEEALRIAEDCGYAWGIREAHDLIGDAATALGQRDRAKKHRTEADALREKLRIPDGYVWPKAKCWESLEDGGEAG